MKILNKSMKRLVLLSTAAILPMLAITSCSDDDDPPAAAGNESEFTQADIQWFFESALGRDNNVGIKNTASEVDAAGVLALGISEEIISQISPEGNGDYRIKSKYYSVPQGAGTAFISSVVVTSFAEDNSAIILTITQDDIRDAGNADGNAIKMEYVLHYNFTADPGGSHQFTLDIAKSYFRVNDAEQRSFGSAYIKAVPVIIGF